MGIAVGVVFGLLKVLKRSMPAWGLGNLDALVPCIMTVIYIVYRARWEPKKLDEWGISTPVTGAAVVVASLLLGGGAIALAGTALALGFGLSFEARYVARMIEYIPAAFPQQFFLCSVGLVSLGKLDMFRGQWRLPIIVGVLFGLAHFWTPAHFPGIQFPLQILVTAPMGFLAAWYFLRYRTILPLTVCHVVLYVFLSRWIESHL